MKLKARIDRIYNQPTILSLEVENVGFRTLCALDKSKEYSVEIKEFKEKRSLNANSLYWKIVYLIARANNCSTTEVHNQLIADYGVVDSDIKTIILDNDIEWKRLEVLHLKPTTSTKVMDNGRLYRVYYVMRGSSTYNTHEMTTLIDGAISEAKQMGINTDLYIGGVYDAERNDN